MSFRKLWLPVVVLFSIALFAGGCKSDPPRRMEILFLGHKNNSNHNSQELASILQKEYFLEGINISFTDNPDDLNESNLAQYDGLIVYANHDTISASQEKALLEFVRSGKGFIPIHSASFCFRNSDEVVEMIGGQFKSHGYDSFPTVIVKPEHEVMQGISSFVTLDETYVHDKISDAIEVLTERVDGDHHEPYTWVRPYGKGRVFYTAYGHNSNTFNNQGFLDLVKNGILWAVGEDAKSNLQEFQLARPGYTDGPVPNYEKRDPAPRVQEALTPEQSMSLIQVPVGFELQLFASEPDIVNPIYINWDEKGRLWAIETVDYPNEVIDDEIGDDRILILEDTNNDGKADKVTVFAEGLNIPTSFVFYDGGIIVSQSPSWLFLKDTDGDGKADIREEIISGWGKNDTHAQSSNLRYGIDNKIWGVVGYSGYNGPVIGSDSIRFGNAVYRFDPVTRELEFLSTTSNNTWGLGFSEDFDVFISTANNTHTAFFGMPRRYNQKVGIEETGVQKLDAHYEMRTATKNLRQVDVMGGFTAAAGHGLYTARTFPKEYWNRIAFVTEPTGRLVHRVVLKQDGAGFIEDGDGWNLFTSADEWAAPIQAEVGPDGAVWVTDWYNFIIQHNPTPTVNSAGYDAVNGKGNAYVNPLRDKSHGRIYRIAYKANNKKNSLKLDKSDPKGLIAALANDNQFWRLTAQRLLVENGDKSVFPELYKLVQNERVDEIGINAGALHALWTLHGLGAFDGSNQEALAVAKKALSHPAAGVRRAAIEVLPKTHETFQAMNEANVFEDADYRVRLAAVLATTDMEPSVEIGRVLVAMAEKPENFADMWLKKGLIIASKLNDEEFKAAFKERGLKDDPSLLEASLAQRLAFGSRLQETELRRTFRRGGFGQPLNPNIANSEWVISGNMQYTSRDQSGAQAGPPTYSGLIVAHGDSRNGYGLYFLDNKLHFTINQGGKQYQVSTTRRLPAQFSFKAGLQKDGMMKLFINDALVGSMSTSGFFKQTLDPAMRVAFETATGKDKVADYPDSAFFLSRGNSLTDAKLEVLKDVKPVIPAGPVNGVIVLNVIKDVMKYDKELITAKAGSTIQIVLRNPDFMQHNLVLATPNSLEKVGAASDQLVRDPNGAKMSYVPDMPEVIGSTPLIDPGGSYTLTVTLPKEPGDYPYVCTFPGHWRIMNGILRVTP